MPIAHGNAHSLSHSIEEILNNGCSTKNLSALPEGRSELPVTLFRREHGKDRELLSIRSLEYLRPKVGGIEQ